jgi:ribonucleoside-diphosphate reductase alpha chain
MNAGFLFYDGITTETIQDILIKSAVDLITVRTPEYQYGAARLLLTSLRKKVFSSWEPKPLLDTLRANVRDGYYQSDLEGLYTTSEWELLDSYIDHSRDLIFTHAALQKVIETYLVKNRVTGEIRETPQIAYMLIAAVIFSNYPKSHRIQYVLDYYNAISQHHISLATPILAGVRTPTKQYSSCILLKAGDSRKSLFAANTVLGYSITEKAGIGLGIGDIRAKGSSVRGGEYQHTGAIGFMKMYEATFSACSQGGLRKGSGTFFYPFWHSDVESFIPLKNNKGTEETRVRRVDFAVCLSKLFYERVLKKQNITLFNPNEVPELKENFGLSTFDALYLEAEKNPNLAKKSVSAFDLFTNILTERSDTGRIYIFNVDHANTHGSFLDLISQSNLCMEVTLPVKEFETIDDPNGEVATCILSAINTIKVYNNPVLYKHLCNLAVRALDEIIDLQQYPFIMTEKSAKNRRSIGIGYINMAYTLAKQNLELDSDSARKFIHELTENLQYFCLEASVALAKEKGACNYFNRTKYSQGILPIDTYKRDIDSFANFPLLNDWEDLRKNILTYGLRNSTLTCIMPSESSSVVANATNGIELPRNPVQVKSNGTSRIKILVPEFNKLNYEYLWGQESNTPYLKMVAIIQKHTDQSISANTSYNPLMYDEGKVPLQEVMEDVLNCYKWGVKALYYHNTYDGNVDAAESGCSGGCVI